MSDIKTFKHGEGTGDLIYGLPTISALGGGDLYLNLGLLSVIDLLKLQPYIHDVIVERMPDEPWRSFKVDYDLDLWRQQDYGRHTVSQCHLMTFGVEFDLSKPWLFNVSPVISAPIVIHDTGQLRFPGYSVDWKILEQYKDNCVFIGYKNEYENFIRDRFPVKYYDVVGVLEVARVIKGSKLFVGNSSLGSALAEGLKCNRVIDLYRSVPQYPLSSNGYYEISNSLIEQYLGV